MSLPRNSGLSSPHSTPGTSSKSLPVNISELISSIKSYMESDHSDVNRVRTILVEGLKELNFGTEGIRIEDDEIAANYRTVVQECDKMKVERLELEDKCKMLERENDVMKGKLVKLKDENSRLQDEVSSVRVSERNTEVMYEKLKLDVEDSKKSRRQMISDLFAKNQSIETEKLKIEEQLKSLREELEGEKQMVKEKEGEITELLEKKKTLETEKGMIMKDLKRKIKEKADEVEGLADKYKTLEKENQGLQLVKMKMEGQLKGLGEELEEEKQQVMEREREIADLLKKNASLDMNKRTIEADFKRKLKEKEDEVEGLTNKYRSLEMEKQDLEMLKGEIEDQLKILGEELYEVEGLTNKYRSLEMEKQDLEMLKGEIEDQLKILGEELEEEKLHVKEKEREIDGLVEKNHVLELNMKRIEDDLKRKLKVKEEEAEGMLKKYRCLEMEKGKIEGLLKDLGEELEGEKVRVKGKEIEISELVMKNEALEMKKEMMEENLKRKVKEKQEEAEAILKKYQDMEGKKRRLEGDYLRRISAIEEECNKWLLPYFNNLRGKYGDPGSHGCGSHHVHGHVNGNRAMRNVGEQPTDPVIKDLERTSLDSDRIPEEPSSIPTDPRRRQLDCDMLDPCGEGTTCTHWLEPVEVVNISDSDDDDDDDVVAVSPVNGDRHDRSCEITHEQVKRRHNDDDISVGKRRKLSEVPILLRLKTLKLVE